MLTEIRGKITQEKKPGVIKALLVGLKDFLMNAGSSLAAALIQTSIQGLYKKRKTAAWDILPHAVIFFAESPSALPRLLAADVEPETFDLRAFDLTSHM